MIDTQLYLAIGIPSLLVILNIIQANLLSDKIDRLAEFLRGGMTNLTREIHSDMVPLHERMAVLEAKQQ